MASNTAELVLIGALAMKEAIRTRMNMIEKETLKTVKEGDKEKITFARGKYEGLIDAFATIDLTIDMLKKNRKEC